MLTSSEYSYKNNFLYSVSNSVMFSLSLRWQEKEVPNATHRD